VVGLKHSGKIEEGFEANLCVVDLNAKWQVNKDTLVSKSKNTPFLGKQLEGSVVYTIHKSNIVYPDKNHGYEAMAGT
jgi:dihydroorotase